MTHHAIQLYDYHVWANTFLINHLQSLPDEVYSVQHRSTKCISFDL